MDATLEPIHTVRKYNSLAIASLGLGLAAMAFPIISAYYLFMANGGAGYLQSLFCGVPITLTGILTGIVSLVQSSRKNQPGAWMAISGIILGTLVSGIACFMVAYLVLPFFLGGAQ
jgi:uncharacterized membrane protein HdeD (DUF308 family)